MVRGSYERIRGDHEETGSGLAPTIYGSTYQNAMQELDPEDPFRQEQAEVVRVIHYDRPDATRRRHHRLFTLAVAPAVAVLLVVAVIVATFSSPSKAPTTLNAPVESATGPQAPVLVNPDIRNIWNEIKGNVTQSIQDAKAKVSPVVDQAKKNITSAIDEAKKKAQPVIDQAKKNATATIDKARDKLHDAKDKAKDKLDDTKSKASDKLDDTKTKASDKLDDTKTKASDKIDDTKAKVDDTKTKAKDKLDDTKSKAKDKIDEIKKNVTTAWDKLKDKVQTKVTPAVEKAKANATSVFSCLDDKCTPLVKSLGQAFKEVANMALLSCLVASGGNKTEAADCFSSSSTRPSELRDNLVNCAGCNGCITVKNQTSIDEACAKYAAWSAKKKAVGTATDGTATELTDPTSITKVSAAAPPATASIPEGSMYSALPKTLKEKYCSSFWCP